MSPDGSISRIDAWSRIFALFACVVLLAPLLACESPPADDELLARFHENRDLFERLVHLMQAQLKDGKFVGLVPDDDPEAGPLMTKVGVKNANANQQFVTFTCSRSVRYGDKGYTVWVTQPSERMLLDSLDGDLPGNDTFYLRQIEGGWYLFRSMAD